MGCMKRPVLNISSKRKKYSKFSVRTHPEVVNSFKHPSNGEKLARESTLN